MKRSMGMSIYANFNNNNCRLYSIAIDQFTHIWFFVLWHIVWYILYIIRHWFSYKYWWQFVIYSINRAQYKQIDDEIRFRIKRTIKPHAFHTEDNKCIHLCCFTYAQFLIQLMTTNFIGEFIRWICFNISLGFIHYYGLHMHEIHN